VSGVQLIGNRDHGEESRCQQLLAV
jgi:hypothetical protein